MSRRIVVTGSGSGIGRALTNQLREEGDAVLGVDLKGGEVNADLGTRKGREHAATEARRFAPGGLDALVACAGISGEDPVVAAVNYFGVVELCEALRKDLAQASMPRAAVVSSISGLHPTDDELVAACLDGDEERALTRATQRRDAGAGHEIYSSSKAALSRWVRRSAPTAGWAGAGIPLNAVAPGVVVSAMTEQMLEDDEMRRLVEESVPMPLGGFAPPEAIATALAWLISPVNTHVTGQVLYADGGADAVIRADATW